MDENDQFKYDKFIRDSGENPEKQMKIDLANLQLTQIPKELYKFINLGVIDLSYNSIGEIPRELCKFKYLKELDLTGNKISEIPEELCESSNLEVLHISYNQLSQLPKNFHLLHKLKELYISNNSFSIFPESIVKLDNLLALGLRGNKFSTLPEDLGQLVNLTWLDIGINLFTEFPNVVLNLKMMTWLILAENKLTELPDEIKNLSLLTTVDIKNNKFTVFPRPLSKLPNLKSLDLRNNEIMAIPIDFLEMKKLKEVYWIGNPWVSPPAEIINRGIGAICDYLRQIERQGLDYLYEAKLLIIGEGGAGKTSLARKILNPSYQLREDKTTKGIDVFEWRFRMDDERNFRVNIWDFGGQEIYHATHQFFLTKRSLYIVVADSRNEDTDFYYWLNIADLLSDNSPLLIINNEKQDRHRVINEMQLRGQFSNLQKTLYTNLISNRGLFEAIAEIKHHITHLPIVGSALPKYWVRVREVLESNKKTHIRVETYYEICEQLGFSDKKDSLQLLGYLHDLGVCLHFQDDPLLNKIVILNPHWGTEAVYKVLDNKMVIDNLGQFTKKDLAIIWKAPEFSTMLDELLQLMMKFRLCYRIPSSKADTEDIFIAPQLLSNNQPEYEWKDNDNLILRYSYEFMPKGIITQFIVAMHYLIANHNRVWRSGVVLKDRKSMAEVIEFYGKHEIRIRICGDRKKELMTIVTYELDKIHGQYKKLKYEKLIPCNCPMCIDDLNPHFYSYEILRNFIDDRIMNIQCLKSYKMVNVWNLLNDVIDQKIIHQEFDEKISNSMPRGRIIKNQKNTLEIGGDAHINTIIIANEINGDLIQTSNLDDILEALNDAVAQMCGKLNETQGDEILRDFETFSNEVKSSAPRPKWYKLSAEGLIKAAKNVGDIGIPVIKLAEQVIALLSMANSSR